jgi:hypothetical protein
MSTDGERADRPGAWPAFPLEVDSEEETVRSDRYQAVAPAVLLHLPHAVPLLALEHFEARYASPTPECVADVLRAMDASAAAETFLSTWRGCMVDPPVAAMVKCLLSDAAVKAAYSECNIVSGFRLTTAQRAKITLTFAGLSAFAAKLEALCNFVRQIVWIPDEATVTCILAVVQASLLAFLLQPARAPESDCAVMPGCVAAARCGMGANGKRADRPGAWPTVPLGVDGEEDTVRSDRCRWYQPVAPAVLLLLPHAVPFLPLEHFEARYASPPPGCVADVLRAIGAGVAAETFLSTWRGCIFDPEVAETVECLLSDAADYVAYSVQIFSEYRLTTAQRAKIALTFADLHAFATRLAAVFDVA